MNSIQNSVNQSQSLVDTMIPYQREYNLVSARLAELLLEERSRIEGNMESYLPRIEDNPLFNLLNNMNNTTNYSEDNGWSWTVPTGFEQRRQYEQMSVEEYSTIVNLNNVHFPF